MVKIEKKDLSKIIGLLNYGTFWGASKVKILIGYICYWVLSLALITLAIVMLSLEQAEDPDTIFSFAIAIVGYSFAFSIIPIIMTILVVKNEKMRNNVNLWIEDAVAIDAYSQCEGIKRKFLFPAVKLRVDFDIDGIHYSKESHSNHYKHKNFEEGYYYIWSKYADRKIKILYSRKYDQVMVLKD